MNPATGGAQGIISMLPMIAILVFFVYFMIIRPQSKRTKEQKKLMDSLQQGDEVITIGGILGKIAKIDADLVVLTIAENTEVTVQKNAISNVLPHGTLKSV